MNLTKFPVALFFLICQKKKKKLLEDSVTSHYNNTDSTMISGPTRRKVGAGITE